MSNCSLIVKFHDSKNEEEESLARVDLLQVSPGAGSAGVYLRKDRNCPSHPSGAIAGASNSHYDEICPFVAYVNMQSLSSVPSSEIRSFTWNSKEILRFFAGASLCRTTEID